MKKLIFVFVMLFAAGAARGQEVIESVDMADFQCVTLSGKMNVELIPAERNRIEVQLWESSAEKFTWGVTREGALAVTLKPTVGNKSRADVRVYYKGTLENITSTGADVTAAKPVEAIMLTVKLSGGAGAKMAVEAQDLELDVSGNSAAAVDGGAKYLTLRATERSRVDTRGLDATAAETESVTGAEVFVKATERLTVTARTGAKIYYTGSPEIYRNRSPKHGLGGGVFNIGADAVR